MENCTQTGQVMKLQITPSPKEVKHISNSTNPDKLPSSTDDNSRIIRMENINLIEKLDKYQRIIKDQLEKIDFHIDRYEISSKKIESQNELILTQKKEIEQMTEELNKRYGRISGLEKDKYKLSEEVDGLETNIEELETKIVELEKESEMLKTTRVTNTNCIKNVKKNNVMLCMMEPLEYLNSFYDDDPRVGLINDIIESIQNEEGTRDDDKLVTRWLRYKQQELGENKQKLGKEVTLEDLLKEIHRQKSVDLDIAKKRKEAGYNKSKQPEPNEYELWSTLGREEKCVINFDEEPIIIE